jgi:uncharacterized membrane-anchored protein
MQNKNVPPTEPRYWTAILIASVFGANMGDFVSHVLHLGHAAGLPPLAVCFVLILLAERRLSLESEVYYWLAIVTVRTAATNLSDLATHDFKQAYPLVIIALAILMAVLMLGEGHFAPKTGPMSRDNGRRGVPLTNGLYWAVMLVAGTLGTAAGDYVNEGLGCGLLGGSLILWGVLAAMLAVRSVPFLVSRISYWLTIVAVRAAGTVMGDAWVGKDGFGLGLPLGTLTSGLAFLVILLLWRRSRRVGEWYDRSGLSGARSRASAAE